MDLPIDVEARVAAGWTLSLISRWDMNMCPKDLGPKKHQRRYSWHRLAYNSTIVACFLNQIDFCSGIQAFGFSHSFCQANDFLREEEETSLLWGLCSICEVEGKNVTSLAIDFLKGPMI